MSDLQTADLYLARLVARAPYRLTLYTVTVLTAAASLWFRVGMGRSDQVLPWYGGILALYGFGMAVASREPRCRAAYAAFGLLVAAAFARELLAAHARAVGAVEVAACLALMWAIASLSRDREFLARAAVLHSGTRVGQKDQEEIHDE